MSRWEESQKMLEDLLAGSRAVVHERLTKELEGVGFPKNTFIAKEKTDDKVALPTLCVRSAMNDDSRTLYLHPDADIYVHKHEFWDFATWCMYRNEPLAQGERVDNATYLYLANDALTSILFRRSYLEDKRRYGESEEEEDE